MQPGGAAQQHATVRTWNLVIVGVQRGKLLISAVVRLPPPPTPLLLFLFFLLLPRLRTKNQRRGRAGQPPTHE